MSDIRRPKQDGQKTRFLHEKAQRLRVFTARRVRDSEHTEA
jgi:hypothetical protein